MKKLLCLSLLMIVNVAFGMDENRQNTLCDSSLQSIWGEWASTVVISNDLKTIEKFIAKYTKEDIEDTDTGSFGPLHCIATLGHPVWGYEGILAILIDAGVNIDKISDDASGWAPIHYAASWGREGRIKKFLQHNAAVYTRTKDNSNRTAYDIARQNNDNDNKVAPLLKAYMQQEKTDVEEQMANLSLN